MTNIDWPEGAIGAFERVDGGGGLFFVKTKSVSNYQSKPGFMGVKLDGSEYHVFTEYWEWRERPVWSGEGLPPVGTVCTVERDDPHSHWAAHCGKQVEIIAHAVSETNNPVAVYKVLIDRCAEYHGLVASCFRPIRTPEQIAADEREALEQETCREIESVVAPYNETISCSAAIRATVNAMLAAGYRKQL